jgi:hypothetical protein
MNTKTKLETKQQFATQISITEDHQILYFNYETSSLKIGALLVVKLGQE